MQDRKILGLIGRIGSGKTVVADYLVEKYGAEYLRFSDVLRDILARVHKLDTRENLQNMGLALRKSFGEGILAETLREDILKSSSKLVVVDGVRYEDEYDMIKEVGGRLVYVTAPDKTRYKRTVKRGTRGEADITFEQFMASEKKETERLIDILGGKADYRIENTGTLDDLRKRVDGIIKG